MAVLPTPGSPIRTGLFFVRRRQHLDHAADLFVATDHRIQLAAAREFVQVLSVLLESLVFGFRVLVGDPLAAAYAGEAFENRIVGRAD